MSVEKRNLLAASAIGLMSLIGLGVWGSWHFGGTSAVGLRSTERVPTGDISIRAERSQRDSPLAGPATGEAFYFRFGADRWAKDHSFHKNAILVWGGDDEQANSMLQNTALSNVRPADYAGAAACQECHQENYQLWSAHPHRWMNARASDQTVKGDFSGQVELHYRGGLATFYRENGIYLMKLARGSVTRVFQINRTLGTRIQQYYIGTLREGPEAHDHAYRSVDHVLPFGFELTMKQWVPIVHAKGQQGPDSARDDPFEIPSRNPYDVTCSMCHTTPPSGLESLVKLSRFGSYSPRNIHFEGSNYLNESFPGAAHLSLETGQQPSKAHLQALMDQIRHLLCEENAINLGISCEACHHGAKAHAENEQLLPAFFPSGPYLHASGESPAEVWGRTDANKNFICARCHSGARPQFAAGMATWNSTEYTDAMRGSCYRPDEAAKAGMQSLTCVACHNPHAGIGRRWSQSPAADNQSCTRCHEQYADAAAAQGHTHHPVESPGSHCMNCHMPRINEGMADMVRTHTIFSPTNTKMIEANQPNACNMCHVEKTIDWTLKYLADWYGLMRAGDPSAVRGGRESYSEESVRRNYPDRSLPATVNWILNQHSGTRMVATNVLAKAKAWWALPRILSSLHDPYMEIRQFTAQRLADYMDIHVEDFGYRHYMTEVERRAPLKRMIEKFRPRGEQDNGQTNR